MDSSEKVQENRIRRAVTRQGWKFAKSRRRDPRAADYGLYRVENTDGAEVAEFASVMGWGLTLDEVEKVLGEQSAAAGRRAVIIEEELWTP